MRHIMTAKRLREILETTEQGGDLNLIDRTDVKELVEGYARFASLIMSGDCCLPPTGAEGKRLGAIVRWWEGRRKSQ